MERVAEWVESVVGTNWFIIYIITWVTLILLRLFFVIHNSGKSPRPTAAKPLSTLIVLGSGGHTAEMLNALSELQMERFMPRYYIAAATDNICLTESYDI